MNCPHCGGEVPRDARFCPTCGAERVAGDGDTRTITRSSGEPGDRDDAPDPGARVVSTGRDADDTQIVAETATRDADPDDTDPDDTDPDLGPVGTGELRTCPACGATNSPRRLLCGRCGADLDSGRPAAPGTGSEDATGTSAVGAERQPPTTRRTVLLVVTGAVALGVVLGAVLLAVGVIGGGDSDGPQVPAFDEPARRLAVERVAASSAADDAHGPGLLADADVSTAWHSSAGDAVGQVLELTLSESAWIRELQLAVGDQSEDGAFASTARPSTVRAVLGDDDTVRIRLLDQPGVQSVRLDPPRRVDTVRLEMLEVVGPEDASLAMAEVAFRGHPTAG